MTRFARPAKKTSLEATPWHELVNSGGNQSSTTASKDSFKTAEKKVEITGLKRKKKFNRDDGATEPKIAKKPKSKKLSFTGDNDYSTGSKISKSESWKAQSGGVGDKGNENSSFSKKGTKIRVKRPGVLSERDFSGKMRNKKFQKKGYLQTGIKKLNRKISTDGSRKESYDKKLEARRKRRAKGKTCFHCRQTGHLVAECPMAQSSEVGVGNCYKCGSSQHTTKNCKSKQNNSDLPFAKCFICGETGHIARACPDNPKGLYPNGGGCKICGSVEHFRRDCPELARNKSNTVTTTHAGYINSKKGHYSADAELEDPGGTSIRVPKKKGTEVVKF
nr:uncharacterized protein LOC131786155 [Pocillopora verrucosa]